MTRTTMILPVPRHGTPATRTTRRRFLRCAAALLAGTLISPPSGRISFAADSDAQWTRLQRGLSREAMAGCRKAADRLMPRLGVLLKGTQWESQTFKAIADELKQAGVLSRPSAAAQPGMHRSGIAARRGGLDEVV